MALNQINVSSAETAKRPASPVDYAEHLLNGLPSNRRPYILAQLVLSGHTQVRIDHTLRAIYDADKVGELQPPLKNDPALKQEVYVMIENYDRERAEYLATQFPSRAAHVLLAWIVNHSSAHSKTEEGES